MKKRKLILLVASGLILGPAGCGDDAPPPRAVGETCVTDADCAEGKCYADLCVSAKPVGTKEACTLDAQCKSLKCSSGKCAAGSAASGAVCLHAEECTSGFCKTGTCAACGSDTDCGGAVCHATKCAPSCKQPSDCATGEDCGSLDDKRYFCYARKYNEKLGTFCGIDGTCPTGLKCSGTMYDAFAFCSVECKTNVDCPPDMSCSEQSDGKLFCVSRRLCSPCIHDGQCPTGHKCISMAGGHYCTSSCNKGSTECPMFAECKDSGGGAYVCMHKSGKCVGDGSLCQACTTTEQCKTGGLCLTFSISDEPFCGTDCNTSGTCQTGYKCYDIATGVKQCGPTGATSTAMPTCTSALTYIMNKGDVMEDFAMVGYRDTDGDNDLADEKLALVTLSEVAKNAKIVLFNISAFW